MNKFTVARDIISCIMVGQVESALERYSALAKSAPARADRMLRNWIERSNLPEEQKNGLRNALDNAVVEPEAAA